MRNNLVLIGSELLKTPQYQKWLDDDGLMKNGVARVRGEGER